MPPTPTPKNRGDRRAEHDLAGGPGRREPSRQHGQLVLAEVLAQAAVQAVGQEARPQPPADNRHAVQSDVRGRGGDLGQPGDPLSWLQRGHPREQARHVDERVAGPAGVQVAAVSSRRPPRPGQRTQRYRAQQPADDGQRQHRPPGSAAGPTPQVQRAPHEPGQLPPGRSSPALHQIVPPGTQPGTGGRATIGGGQHHPARAALAGGPAVSALRSPPRDRIRGGDGNDQGGAGRGPCPAA